MPLSSSDIATLTSFSWAEIKVAALNAIASGLLGGTSLKINDREVALVSPEEAQRIYQWADAMEQIEATGNTAVARFGDPV